MKSKILDLQGKEKGNIDLPKVFEKKVREDIVAKIIEAKKTMQPYSPSLVAGRQYSAQGQQIHRRKVWKSQYGRGMSRIPRKIMMRRGSQFHWEGAVVPNTKGGRRAHPPKTISMTNFPKINKKELKIAFESALSATSNEKYVLKKYSSLNKLDKKIPLIISLSEKTKIKEILKGLKQILGEDLYNIAVKKKKIRSGKGKMRGRKYKVSAGMLLVTGNEEELKTKMFEVRKTKNLGIMDLAEGGLGRLTIYTEKAIKDLNEKLKTKENKK
jgi:large subunit ribosomal protein L4e